MPFAVAFHPGISPPIIALEGFAIFAFSLFRGSAQDHREAAIVNAHVHAAILGGCIRVGVILDLGHQGCLVKNLALRADATVIVRHVGLDDCGIVCCD